MSESQSRYSIVERLTETKLEIMTAKADLEDQVLGQKQKISNLEIDLKNWKEDIQESISREERNKKINIDKEKQNLKNLEERLNEKRKVFDEKLVAIEKSLVSIEEISKTSPTIQK